MSIAKAAREKALRGMKKPTQQTKKKLENGFGFFRHGN
jgi:hypothetical protein